MMNSLSYLNYNPQDTDPQYLEDLATGYWFSEAFFTAVEMEIFTFLEPHGMNVVDLSEALNVNADGLERFMQALSALGLVTCGGGNYYNSAIASAYLVIGKENYQGDSILWRKTLTSGWRDLRSCLQKGGRVEYTADDGDEQQLVKRVRKYIKAMDCVARTKVLEMLPIFSNVGLDGQILDVGAGSGAIAAGFLRHFPGTHVTLLDLSWVLDYTKELMDESGLAERVTCSSARKILSLKSIRLLLNGESGTFTLPIQIFLARVKGDRTGRYNWRPCSRAGISGLALKRGLTIFMTEPSKRWRTQAFAIF